MDVARALAGIGTSKRFDIIIWQIRLPQVLAAVVAGAGLSVSGAVMQSTLRNPLGSPFTLGISHAAAFAVMILGAGTMTSTQVGAMMVSNPYVTTDMAFVFAMLVTFFIVARYGDGGG